MAVAAAVPPNIEAFFETPTPQGWLEDVWASRGVKAPRAA